EIATRAYRNGNDQHWFDGLVLAEIATRAYRNYRRQVTVDNDVLAEIATRAYRNGCFPSRPTISVRGLTAIRCHSVIETDQDRSLDRESERTLYYRLMYQISRMVRAKGALSVDDRVDTLAIGVAYWMKHLARDTEKAVLEHHEKKFN